jgi:hypothetical protein
VRPRGTRGCRQVARPLVGTRFERTSIRLTGFAYAWYYRRRLLSSLRQLLLVGLGAFVSRSILLFVFLRSCFDFGRADAGSTTYFGVGSPLVIGLGFLLVGAVLIVSLAGRRAPGVRPWRPGAAEPITRSVARGAAVTA